MTEGHMPYKSAKSITLLVFSALCLGHGTAVAQVLAGGPVVIKPDAPARYTVVRGDTLWAIAERFSDSPWRWPELWGFNREQIRNPHLIFPGNVIVLDRVRGRLSIASQADGEGATRDESRTAGAQGEPVSQPGDGSAMPSDLDSRAPGRSTAGTRPPRDTFRLAPRMRVEPAEGAGIPSIPLSVIEPFLTQPLVVDPGELESGPAIVASEEDRVLLSPGNVGYARGLSPSGNQDLFIYRRGQPLVDPESGKVLGHEAIFLGTAGITRTGDPATIRIQTAQHEIVRGDRLVPAGPANPPHFMPRAPSVEIRGRIMTIYGGGSKVGEASRLSIITLNRGRAEGLEVGHVLALYRHASTVTDVLNRERVQVPEERYGLAFVFRVFERVSYALVMTASKPVRTHDDVRNP